MTGCFSLCMDLHGKTVLVAGSGPLAREKVETLPFGARLRLFDMDWEPCAQIEAVGRPLEENDLAGPVSFVVVGDAPRREQERISALCIARSIPVNVVDVPELCSFYFPALYTNGAMTVAVSTAGKSPSAAIWMKQAVAKLTPSHTAEILEWAFALRTRLQQCTPDWKKALRRAVFRAMEENRTLTEQEAAACAAEKTPAAPSA